MRQCDKCGHVHVVDEDQEWRVKLPYLLAQAKSLGVCRICGEPATARIRPNGSLEPFIFGFGKEHAHYDCLCAEAETKQAEVRLETTVEPQYDTSIPPIEETLAKIAAEIPPEESAKLPLIEELLDPAAENAKLRVEIAHLKAQLWPALWEECQQFRNEIDDAKAFAFNMLPQLHRGGIQYTLEKQLVLVAEHLRGRERRNNLLERWYERITKKLFDTERKLTDLRKAANSGCQAPP